MLEFWLLLLCLGVFYLYKTMRFKYWENKGVKQNIVLRPFGDNLEPVLKGFTLGDFLIKQYSKFPNARYSGLYLFNKPVLMLRDPDLIKKICVKDSDYFMDHMFLSDNPDPLWYKSMVCLKGQKWKEMRTALTPLFTGNKIKQMYFIIQENAENFVNYFSQSSDNIQEVDVEDAFTRYANDIITNIAFGLKCDSFNDQNNEIYLRGKQTSNFLEFWKNIKFNLIEMMPYLKNFMTTLSYDEEVSKFFRKVVQDVLDRKINDEHSDVVSVLVSKKERFDWGKLLEVDDITAQALLFLIAGLETTSTALCFMAYELALNPDIQQKLIQELDEFRIKNKIVTYDNIGKLTYLDMVVSETLRKWSPNYVTDRKCAKSYVIEPEFPDEIPVQLTEMDSIIIPIWALHHDPKYWKNPKIFDPERFSFQNKENIKQYSFIPFGMGQRNCIASRFAVHELKTFFFKILEKFEFLTIKKTPIPFMPSKTTLNLSPGKEFWLGLKKR